MPLMAVGAAVLHPSILSTHRAAVMINLVQQTGICAYLEPMTGARIAFKDIYGLWGGSVILISASTKTAQLFTGRSEKVLAFTKISLLGSMVVFMPVVGLEAHEILNSREESHGQSHCIETERDSFIWLAPTQHR